MQKTENRLPKKVHHVQSLLSASRQAATVVQRRSCHSLCFMDLSPFVSCFYESKRDHLPEAFQLFVEAFFGEFREPVQTESADGGACD